MPILNPQQAFNIWHSCDLENNQLIPFLNIYLPIASQNILLNRKMDEVHNNLKNYLVENISLLAKSFDFKTDEIIKQIQQNEMDNVYTFLSNTIKSKYGKHKESFPLTNLNFAGYLNNQITNLPDKKRSFLIPFKSKQYGWYISNESIAVLSFKIDDFSYVDNFLIQITASVLVGAGYTLILCLFDYTNNDSFSLYKFTLDPQLFSETHIFVEKTTNGDPDMNNLLRNQYGHTYIYIHFDQNVKEDIVNKIEKSKNHFTHIFTFSKKLNDIFYAPNSATQLNFEIQKFIEISLPNTFSINLCNVALYETNNKNEETIPIGLSGISYGIISADDYFYSKFKRVLVTIDNKKYYVEFPELAYMNPELYISEPMYLSKQSLNISAVEEIYNTYTNETSIKDHIKSSNSDLRKNDDSKLFVTFHYIHKYSKDSTGGLIKPYMSQIFAVYQAISLMNNPDIKGCVLQVQTGEGKSIIIQALAQLLARQGSNVHIATSNIILAARDFENGYNFYRNCAKKYSSKKKPTILLHQNERKFIDKFLETSVKKEIKEAFYDDRNFNNPTNMNISVFQKEGKYTSNIIYSTFLNFEAFYLSQFSKNKEYIAEYFNNCYLIIDEADTILIDELINGTILSKPMNSNAEEVLEFIYYQYTHGNDKISSIFSMVKDKFPSCVDISEEDIQRIISDIQKVTAFDFSLNNRYIIDNNDEGKQVVIPFDSEHKGIAEPNKEFSGFIHQLIGIKEKQRNPEDFNNLQIQPLSMNYLFISHPIYVNKYKGVCGLTGTIGTKKDKEILKKYYKLVTQKVPRNKMNLRKDLPMILCKNIKERNERICKEIQILNKMEYPVLVVFNDINEINEIKKMLVNDYSIPENKISIFTGKNINTSISEADKEKLEKESGKLSSITLGTNFCGRGVSIEYSEKPLYVIVSYFNDNKRSINQVLGRSGRNGNPGITRIICTKEMFYKGTETVTENVMSKIINEFDIKNQTQLELINEIQQNYSWIFNETSLIQRLTIDDVSKLRKYPININRITAYKCKFPLCMSVESFLDIQAQRIFSLKNCPECKQTWNLFRIYMRELILESWSLFLDSVDFNIKKLIENNKKSSIKNTYLADSEEGMFNFYFKCEYDNYKQKLAKYFPFKERKSVIELFLHIHDIVGSTWNDKVLSKLSGSILAKNFETSIKGGKTFYRFGFFPISLAENSGIKMSPLTENEQKIAENEQLYCIDPELKYINLTTHKPLSITRILDALFDTFRNLINDKLFGLFHLRLFLRRTLSGCEFGICIDPSIYCNKYLNNCLVDQNPIMMLTICTKSSFFWIAGIIIMLLVFASSLFTLLASKYLPQFEFAKKAYNKIKGLISKVLWGDDDDIDNKELGAIPNAVNEGFDKIIDFLRSKIEENLEKTNSDIFIIVKTIFKLTLPDFDDKLSDIVFAKMTMNERVKHHLKQSTPIGKLITISILLIIMLGTFLLKFHSNKSIQFSQNTQKQINNYDQDVLNSANLYQKLQKDQRNDNITNSDSYKSMQSKISGDVGKLLIDNQ